MHPVFSAECGLFLEETQSIRRVLNAQYSEDLPCRRRQISELLGAESKYLKTVKGGFFITGFPNTVNFFITYFFGFFITGFFVTFA